MNEKYIDALQDAIQNTHGCASRHVGTIAVEEAFQGETVWQGDVEVFDLIGHPKASQSYAWGFHDDAGKWLYVAVLKVAKVDTPRKAVQAYILSHRGKEGIQ